MANVKLDNLKKEYEGGVVAVKGVSVEIKDKEFVVLVGPSGCGKSTTLRMIAGLEDISSGTLTIDQKIVNDVPPKDRDIAMVFQNYALYPHMSVYENMAFGLKLRKFPKDEIDKRVRDLTGRAPSPKPVTAPPCCASNSKTPGSMRSSMPRLSGCFPAWTNAFFLTTSLVISCSTWSTIPWRPCWPAGPKR